jgi:hypothetical protein
LPCSNVKSHKSHAGNGSCNRNPEGNRSHVI